MGYCLRSTGPGVTGGELPVADAGGQVAAAPGVLRAEGQVGGLSRIVVQVVELVLAGRAQAELPPLGGDDAADGVGQIGQPGLARGTSAR